MTVHEPRRGDEVAAWIKRTRDDYREQGGYRQADALDALLDDYRLHADTGTPLGLEVQGPGADPTPDELIDEVATMAGTAKDMLAGTLAALCPGGAEHGFAVHRDGKPAWCSLCRRTEWGVKV